MMSLSSDWLAYRRCPSLLRKHTLHVAVRSSGNALGPFRFRQESQRRLPLCSRNGPKYFLGSMPRSRQ